MSFRKPCHMPFRKLIPPFTLTDRCLSFVCQSFFLSVSFELIVVGRWCTHNFVFKVNLSPSRFMLSVWLCFQFPPKLRGFFLTGSRHDIIFTIDQRTLLGTCYIFSTSLPLQYLSVCICMNKRGLMFALRWASIQCSSQFSYLTRDDFIVFTVHRFNNRE